MTAQPTVAAPARRPVWQVVLHAPAPVKVLTVGVFVSRLGSFFATFATLFLTHRGFTTATVAPVLIAIGLAGMAGSLSGGALADRFGHRTTLVVSMLAASSAVALLAVAAARPVLIVAVCLVAFWTAAYPPAAAALLVDNSAPIDRVPMFAFFRLSLNLGAALGPLLAGVLAGRSYALLFGVEAAAYAVCAAIIFLGLPARPSAQAMATTDRVAPAAGAGRPLRAWVLCALLFGVAAIYVQYQSTLPLQLQARGFGVSFYGALLALNGFLVIGAELPISAVTRRLTWVLPLVVGIATMTAGLLLAASSGVAFLVVAGFVVFTVGEMIFAPVANAAVAELSPSGTTARLQGLLSTAQSLGFSLGPAIGTALFAASPAALWAGTAGAATLLCAGIFSVWRSRR